MSVVPAGGPSRIATVWFGEARRDDVPVWKREELAARMKLAGPALVLERGATIVLEPGFELEAQPDGVLIVRAAQQESVRPRKERGGSVAPPPAEPDPVLLEVFSSRFVAIAEQMGTILQRTALSTNIRERLDFSCAVFDRDGGLVANAPHIPVHLGAMGESVRAVMRAHPSPQPGDVFVTNDPALGGSHLPDVTVVTPVHDGDGRLAFFTACRGHHADVGGITPGSMPPFSRTLEEEGVVFRAIPAVREGRFLEEDLRAV